MIPASLTREWVAANYAQLSGAPSANLVLDFTATTRIDTAGIALVRLLHKKHEAAGSTLILRNIGAAVLSMIERTSDGAAPPAAGRASGGLAGFLERTGRAGFDLFDLVVKALSVLTEMMYWGSFGLLKKRDIRKGVLGEQMYQLGFKAFAIVAILSLLVGIVLALQTAMQLRQFGAGIFLAPMIGISMIRELGPLLTAIILAGRSGSSTTAEIATMGVGEELDALQTMGLNPIQFVVVPKFWAITLTMPVLSLVSTATGIFSGFLVSFVYLGISPNLFWVELSKNIFLRDFTAGFIKSVVFSWLIVWIGSFYGLKVRGGAEAVGRETTASVVTAIFAIIVADAVFSFIL